METAVRKATRLDYNPPKQKHLSTLVSLTFHNPLCIGDMLDLLERRHRENSWIMSFKVLVILHILMRQGNGDRTIAYMENHPACLDTTRLREKSSGVIHIQNIYLYTAYLQQKVAAYRELGVDYIKATISSKVGRLRRLSVDEGLLKEIVVLQKQVGALLKCKFILDDVDNTISVFAFKLVVEDLLILFQVINEGVVNILEQYFAMPKKDALTSLEIYKRFAKQTEEVTVFLDRARQFQQEMYIAIPTVKHAPLSLVSALEEYLNDLNSKPTSQQGNNTVHATSIAATTTTTTATTTHVHKESDQPKNLVSTFSSLETDITTTPVTTPQPSLHNPFRNTVSGNNASTPLQYQQPDNANQPQQPFMSMITSPSLTQQQQPNSFALPTTIAISSPLPTNSNPFRIGNDMQQQPNQPSTFLKPSSQQLVLFQPSGSLPQQQQQQQTPLTSIGHGSFVPSTPSTAFSNPFLQQQQQQQVQSYIQTPQPSGMNPFAISNSAGQSQQNQHHPQQQQQSWGP